MLTKSFLGRISSVLFVFRDPWEMLRDGDFANVEIMIGTNQDEGKRGVGYLNSSIFANCGGKCKICSTS